ncbi:Transcriptional regulator, LysR family, partial [Moritella viscosa]|uniref:LysR family transcriptional regulator n=1 Tax=Moritella viscosa TaxID=80854 RepID=UPI0009166A5A
MKTVTHLNSLRAIEATARLGSYASAAKEIGVTPEAIGQLVRSYEAYLTSTRV